MQILNREGAKMLFRDSFERMVVAASWVGRAVSFLEPTGSGEASISGNMPQNKL
jgi:hypothetical protein